MTTARAATGRVRRRPLRAVESLAAGLAHEVRNPLNALRINLSILQQELSGLVPDREAHVFEVAKRIAGELRQLDDFVSEFLRYARPPRLKLESLEVEPLVADLARFIGPEFERKGVRLSVALRRGRRRLRADGSQLKHALLNLLLNALEATPRGGSVRLETAGDDRRLDIVVRDSGAGLPAEELERVFEAFYSTREGGTGLGLPIARRIAMAHRGTLVLRSRPARGTTATISLPVVAAPRAAAAPARRPRP